MKIFKSGGLLLILLCFVVLLGGGLHGCGKKADPKPPDVPPPAAISDLRATLVESGVLLSWSKPEAKGFVQNYKIQRSELDKERASCIDCPREFILIADASLYDPASPLKEEGNTINYLDFKVKSEHLYSYQVIACDMEKHCGEASNIVEMKIGAKFRQGKGEQKSK